MYADNWIWSWIIRHGSGSGFMDYINSDLMWIRIQHSDFGCVKKIKIRPNEYPTHMAVLWIRTFLRDPDPNNWFGSGSGAERIQLQILLSKTCFFMLKNLNLVSNCIYIDFKITWEENFSTKIIIFTTVKSLILRKFDIFRLDPDPNLFRPCSDPGVGSGSEWTWEAGSGSGYEQSRFGSTTLTPGFGTGTCCI